jgi:hypothetical protein
MKKISALLATAGLLLVGTSALARNFNGHWGKHAEKNWEHATHHSLERWHQGGNNNIANLTETAALQKVEEYLLKNNIKGYALLGANSTEIAPNLIIHTVSANDSGGNIMLFHVNPYGHVTGPIPDN